MKNKFLILFIVVLIVLTGIFIYEKSLNPPKDTKSNNEVVAEVNGEKIYLSDVALHYFSSVVAYKIQMEEIKKNFGEEGLEELSKYEPDPMKSLNSIIDNKLLVQYAKSKGYREDEEYLKNLVSEQKKWFHYELNGLPPDINFDPVSKKLFDEASKLIKDMVRKSGLSEEELFNKKYIPTLKDAAIVHSMFKDLEKNISDEEKEKLREKLIDKLRSRGNIKILNKEKVINLKNEIP